MGFEIADLRALGADYTGQMVVYLAAGANPISEAAWETYQPDPGFMLNTPRAGQFDVLNVLGSPYQPTGSFTFYTDSAGYTWQAVAAVENRVYPFDAADYEGSSPPITTSAQAGYQLSTPLPGTIQYNSNDKNHENVYYAKDAAGNPILQYFVTDPWSNVYILKSVNAANDTPDKVAAAVDAAVLPSEDWVKSSGYLANDQSYLPTYSGNVAHANEFRDSADSAWMQISWGSLGITLPAVVGEGMPIWGGSSDDYLVGTDADDEIHSGGGDDTIAGVDGSDRISGDAGNDRIEGGNGTTTAVFFGTSIEYSIQYMPTSIVVTDSVVGRDGTDTLINVQSLEFSDGIIVPCFAAGTRIRTLHGEVPVEMLTVGDEVATLLTGRSAPIVWIGQQVVDCAAHLQPMDVWPVRIRAHAFGSNQPDRDLLLSPDHALYAEGVLIPVKYLVNDRSVTQIPCDTVTYYHIELPRHDVISAEGLPVESYLDIGDRSDFASGRGSLFPGQRTAVQPTAFWEALGCAPLVVTGPEVEAVRWRLR